MSQRPEFVGIEEPGETAAQYLGGVAATSGAFAGALFLWFLGPFGILFGYVGGLLLGTIGGRKLCLTIRQLFR